MRLNDPLELGTYVPHEVSAACDEMTDVLYLLPQDTFLAVQLWSGYQLTVYAGAWAQSPGLLGLDGVGLVVFSDDISDGGRMWQVTQNLAVGTGPERLVPVPDTTDAILSQSYSYRGTEPLPALASGWDIPDAWTVDSWAKALELARRVEATWRRAQAAASRASGER